MTIQTAGIAASVAASAIPNLFAPSSRASAEMRKILAQPASAGHNSSARREVPNVCRAIHPINAISGG